MRPRPTWHLLTSEYPPKRGGVSDYTQTLARELAARHESVVVWAPGHGSTTDGSVPVHRPTSRFGLVGLIRLGAALSRHPRPRRLFVQYTPHGWGYKAMNVLVPIWFLWRRVARRDTIWVLFHEVAYPWEFRPRRRLVLGVVTRLSALITATAAEKLFVTVPFWTGMLRGLGIRKPTIPLPVPAAVSPPSPAAGTAARTRWRTQNRALIGHFGTFGPLVGDQLAPALAATLATVPTADVLLIGAGEKWAANFIALHPEFAPRVRVTGRLAPEELAATLAACDVLLQPYPDGISGRRTTAMAALAVGVPLVTTDGFITEPYWRTAPVRLIPTGDATGLATAIAELLANPPLAATLAAGARAEYTARFAIGRAVDLLVESPVKNRAQLDETFPT